MALTQGIAGWKPALPSLEGVIALETAYQAKSQMTFQQFCQQVLGQSAAVAKQMNDLWLVYASGKVEYDKDSPTGAETPDQGGALSGELLHNDPEDVLRRTPPAGTVRLPAIIPTVRPKRLPAAVLKARDAGSGTGDQVSSGAQNPPDSSNTDENGSENTGSGENNGENNGRRIPKGSHRRPKSA